MGGEGPRQEETGDAGAESFERFRGESLKDLRILAVEDDAAAREALARLLGDYGAKVICCSSGAEALAELNRSTSFDLLLTDLGLSPVDGFELLTAVRAQYPAVQLPAIAVTGFTREEDRARAMAVGFQAYIAKPYEVAKLIALACAWGGRRSGG